MSELGGGLHEDELVRLGVEAMLDPHHPIKVETSDWAAQALGNRDLVDADRGSTFALDDWRTCAERGIHGLLVPQEYGGRGSDLITAALTLEGLGHGCRDNGFVYALASQIVSTQIAIEWFGDDRQKAEWLPRLCDGSAIGAFAITEAESGSDVYQLSTSARRVEGGYVLSGHKSYITLASRCDVVLVFASTDPEAGAWGLSAFLVPTTTDGVELLGNREKMGMRTTPFGDISLDEVFVPEEARLGPEGIGARMFAAVLEVERGVIFIVHVGAMERQLDDSLGYALSRHQGGSPIIDHQAVGHRLADMKSRHESARTLIYKTALQMALGRPATMTAVVSKLVASEAAVTSALDATLTHGAVGYVTEHEVERNLRDAVGGLIYSGTSDIQRNILLRLMRAEHRASRSTAPDRPPT